jgi:hypothetical protein
MLDKKRNRFVSSSIFWVLPLIPSPLSPPLHWVDNIYLTQIGCQLETSMLERRGYTQNTDYFYLIFI